MYLLDANVVSYFLNLEHHEALARAAAKTPLVIVAEVYSEIAKHPKHGGIFKSWFPTSGLSTVPIIAGSPAHDRLSAFPKGTRGKGERESIAVASADPRYVFVANDRNAMWLALRELHAEGQRVIGFPPFIRRIASLSTLSGRAADGLLKAGGHAPPTWWPDWRASLT